MRVALVSGGTSGIGLAAAEMLAKAGYRVFVGARRQRPLPQGVAYVALDVSSEESVASAVNAIRAECGRLDLLVHSAGMGIAGAAEDTPNDAARLQMDVNFFGVLNLNRAALPLMRETSGAKVIIVGSVAGRIPIPFQSHYTASKFALEGYALAMRMEIAPLGVQVCIIEPGDTATGFTSQRTFALPEGSPYEISCRRSIAVMERDEQGGASPEASARLIVKLAGKRRLPPRVTVGFSYKLLVGLSRILPHRLIEFVLSLMYKTQK